MDAWKTVLVTSALAVLLVADPSVFAGLRADCGCHDPGGRSCSGGVCCVSKSGRAESPRSGAHGERHQAPRGISGSGHGATPATPVGHVCGCTLRSATPDGASAAATSRILRPGLLVGPISAPQPSARAETRVPIASVLPASFILIPEAPPPRFSA